MSRTVCATSEQHWQVAGLRVKVRRSTRRKSLALQVRGGVVTAYAPLGLAETTIRSFVETKREWLRQHVTEQQRRLKNAAPQDGQAVPFLGELLILRFAAIERPRREGPWILVPSTDPAGHLEAWTREAALPDYTRLVEDYAERLGVRERLRRVRVSGARSRWGSCTASGDIRLHWALSRAPLEVLHYVALHEAAHLLELNHSPRYWQHVARLMPDHARWRQWLRDHGEELGAGARGG